ncbi:carbon-nitrogen hydrolase family protein [Nonomuraea sp. NPDC049152]|uniref:carbon-nitrogen hydrolase family protein n=1 Tax=Nonomuraea sp. NPDC049152 TaxID=3154350 RepID=UPI0033C6E21B
MRVAAVQAAPVWLDAQASTDKAIDIIDKAAGQGAELVAFGESWLPGYPFWIWTRTPSAGVPYFLRYDRNAVTTDGPELAAIRSAARRHQIHVALGFAERAAGSLYCSQALISDQGELLAVRRKLKPTHVERSLWGEGDGSDLLVTQTRLGRIGMLNCWEHIQPLSRYALYSMDEQIHIASWPALAVSRVEQGAQSARHVCASYALEGQCFVLSATNVLPAELAEELAPAPGALPPGGGAAAVFAPNTTVLAESSTDVYDEIVVTDCDLSTIRLAKMTADPVGHYARPDATRLLLDRTRRTPVVLLEPGTDPSPADEPEPAPETGA